MIKMTGIFTLRLITRDSNKLERLSLYLEDALIPLFMTSIESTTKDKSGNQLEIDFEISLENMVIEKGKYRLRLTGTSDKFNQITLFRQLEQRDNIIFSLSAETESNTEAEVKVRFALHNDTLSSQAASSIQ